MSHSLQISFLIPPNKIPGRVALLITISLCMFNTLNSVARDVPPTDKNPTALVRWIIGCLLFILSAMCEYGFLLLLRQSKSTNDRLWTNSRRDQLDKFMLVIFPTCNYRLFDPHLTIYCPFGQCVM